MKTAKKFLKNSLSYLLAVALVMSMILTFPISTFAAEGTSINYTFSGKNADDAGYAEGTITLTSENDGTYYLYWADNTKALDGYYEIDELTISDGNSASFEFGYHTAIPANATKVIAVTDKTDLTVSSAAAVYSIPVSKQLNSGSGELLYTFNSYSDVHIDTEGYYVNAEDNWAQALKYASDMDTDFIVSSGDMVTNAAGPESEWLVYEKVLSESDYVNPVWESDGNHDMRSGVSSGLTSFVRASGTDSTIANYDDNKPYYYVTEQTTGDIFIFMALESDSNPSSCDEFSEEQIQWLVNLLDTYYGTGINIYIIEHSPIKGFGAGDRMEKPYYKAHLSEKYISTVQFKAILQKYPELIWMSGHTHEDYTMGYNYSDEDGTACHMIHNPAVAGSTWASESATSLDYNNGVGYNSQGYYVETYENQVVYYGANLTDELIYPEYCYIMDGSRNTEPDATNPTEEATTQGPDDEVWETGSTLPSDVETNRFYFANTLKWQYIDCYSWSDDDTSTCQWPGYAAVYYGTTEQGVDLYYCDVPADHTKIIWNNAGNSYQTVDITLDGVNDFFTPASTESSKTVPVTASVWDYNPVTDPSDTYELGDVNMDNNVDIDDATEIQKYIACLVNLSEEQLALADVNFDNDVTIMDVTVIQKYIAELIDKFEATDVSGDDSGEDEVIENTKESSEVSESTDKDSSAVSALNESNESDDAKGETSDYTWTANTLEEALIQVKQELEANYTFSSYDQYQSLKKYYYQYKDISSVDNESEVVTEFGRLSKELNVMVEHIGISEIYTVGNIYYFENTNDWETVNCYAWKGSSTYATWPGLAMQKVGTNNGHDVYGVRFDYSGQYTSLIFNNGTDQTVNIALNTFEFNCFCLDGTTVEDDGKTKFNVSNYNYDSEIQPTVAPTTTNPTSGNELYALCYYNSTYHDWSDIDTFFKKQSDGTYVLNFVTTNSENISCNVYDNSSATYNCVATSTALYYSEGETNTYSLNASSSKGKSITIYGPAEGAVIKFVYDPADNTLTITCKGISESEPQESDDYALCYYNSTYHAWDNIDTFFNAESDGTYSLKFTATNSENISLNVYDNYSATYNCVSTSTPLTYSEGNTSTYSLNASSARGKSITISGLSEGVVLEFVYDPTENTLTITCS